MSALKNAIRDFDWVGLFENLNVHDMVDSFTNSFINLAKMYIPTKSLIVSDSDAPWMNTKIKYAIKNNKNIYKNWVKNGKIQADKTLVNKSQRETNKLIQLAKNQYIKSLGRKICDPDCGAKIFWSSYKRLLNNKKTQTFRLCRLMAL